MAGTSVDFRANGHITSGHLAAPPSGTGPAVIVIQEYWGLVPHIVDVCERFAAAGFVALAPDLYHGAVAKSPDAAGKLYMALNIDQAGKDMRGAADHLLAHPAVTSKTAGIVGFCMGGQLALYAGAEYPGRFGAVVDFYGMHPNVRIDPARTTSRSPSRRCARSRTPSRPRGARSWCTSTTRGTRSSTTRAPRSIRRRTRCSRGTGR